MKKYLPIILILLFVTAAAGIFYLSTRDRVGRDEVLVRTPDSEIVLQYTAWPFTDMEGEQTNQKGETKHFRAKGYALSGIPEQVAHRDYTQITVISDDEYSAVLTREEVLLPNNAWLILEDGELRLVVLQDPNTKRSVKHVVRIEIR